MADDDLTLDDMIGFHLMPQNTYYMNWTGHWVNAVPGPTPRRVKIARATGGALNCFLIIYSAASSLNGLLHESALTDISMNLIVISTAVSSMHKYCIFMNQQQGLGRLGRWMKRVTANKKANNIPDTLTDVILRRSLKVFYYSGNAAPLLLSIKMLLTGNTYNMRPPGITHPHPVLLRLFIIFTFTTMAWEVIVTGAVLMNSLFTFRAELMRVVEEWKNLKFDPDKPEEYTEGIKVNVKKHIELIEIFRDLKEYNNSMFGYQVFAVVFTTCALIYGCAKDTEFIGEALIQVLPTATASGTEFGILCWTGEEIRHSFQQVYRNIYMTNWYEAPLRDKKSMVIVMEFSKNLITLTGFTVFTATLDTFVEDAKFSGEALIQVLPAATASVTEFAILCWTGEEIRHAFQQVYRNIYMTNWYEAPLRDKKSMVIVMEFSKNLITLTGFTVFTATLATFVEALTDISMNLIVISTAVSSMHKYSIFMNQQQGLGRLGRWVKRVTANKKANKIPDTLADVILRRSLIVFYYTGNAAPLLLSIKMLLTGNTYNMRPPGIAHPHPVLLRLFIMSALTAMGCEVVVTGAVLMNSLFTFRAELMRVVEEWKNLKFDPDKPEEYTEGIKVNVKKHIELIEIFRDLKEYNNSMFGYQVFAVVFTTCALIYGCAKDTEFIGEALIQVLPTATASGTEFGILCWTGEEIRHSVYRNIYMTNWYEAPLRDKKSMVIVMEFSKNLITLTGFTVFTATLDTFVESMKRSFSLYTIIKAVL